jgi:hypothetical protein
MTIRKSLGIGAIGLVLSLGATTDAAAGSSRHRDHARHRGGASVQRDYRHGGHHGGYRGYSNGYRGYSNRGYSNGYRGYSGGYRGYDHRYGRSYRYAGRYGYGYRGYPGYYGGYGYGYAPYAAPYHYHGSALCYGLHAPGVGFYGPHVQLHFGFGF